MVDQHSRLEKSVRSQNRNISRFTSKTPLVLRSRSTHFTSKLDFDRSKIFQKNLNCIPALNNSMGHINDISNILAGHSNSRFTNRSDMRNWSKRFTSPLNNSASNYESTYEFKIASPLNR